MTSEGRIKTFTAVRLAEVPTAEEVEAPVELPTMSTVELPTVAEEVEVTVAATEAPMVTEVPTVAEVEVPIAIVVEAPMVMEAEEGSNGCGPTCSNPWPAPEPYTGPPFIWELVPEWERELDGLSNMDTIGLPEEEQVVGDRWNAVKGPSLETEVLLVHLGAGLKELQEKNKAAVQWLLRMVTTEKRSKEAKELAWNFQKKFQEEVAKMEEDLRKLRDV